MPDIALRFHRDMLVLSAPIDTVLQKQGFDIQADREYAVLVEPEAVRDALHLNQVAGAQCLVLPTAGITPARLAHHGLEESGSDVVRAAIAAVCSLHPQHVLLEIGPCGLPLDASSKASLNENRDQYARATRSCEGCTFDALYLNGFTNLVDLKCALMGVRQVSSTPVFASLALDGVTASSQQDKVVMEAMEQMQEWEANVAGFSTGAAPDEVIRLAKQALQACSLPIAVSLIVGAYRPRQLSATSDNPYYCPDMLVDVGVALRKQGVQFLRATKAATPAYTGALVAASAGYDVLHPNYHHKEG